MPQKSGLHIVPLDRVHDHSIPHWWCVEPVEVLCLPQVTAYAVEIRLMPVALKTPLKYHAWVAQIESFSAHLEALINMPIQIQNLKNSLLTQLHEYLHPRITHIQSLSENHDDKAKLVNKEIKNITEQIRHQLLQQAVSHQDKQVALLALQYCSSIASLEYRHQVWPYEYMAFSRRIGELWESFCKACWDFPSIPNVARIQYPQFSQLKNELLTRFINNTNNLQQQDQILADVNHLFELIGEINLKEDEVFSCNGIPHVIDFKSGFGSNEKGNTLRLLAVGRAYRLWNPNTVLLLLVRQEDNNNYLEVIRRSGLWEVHCADAAYAKIDQLTGSPLSQIKNQLIDFDRDLSSQFLNDINGQLSNLRSYLNW